MTTEVKKRGPGRPPKAKTVAPGGEAGAGAGAGKQVTVQNRYDAAGTGRRMRGWNPPTSGPNRATQGLQMIRNRARDAVRNDWAGESGAQKWATALIGIGITPRFKRIKDTVRRQYIADLFTDFAKESDADGVLNIFGQQTLVVRGWADGGEMFVRRRDRSLNAPLTVPMQVQLLEGDMCPLFDADTWTGLPAGNVIRSGIELNNFGRRIAYWFYKQHPGDQPNGGMPTPDQLVRVAASQVRHVFEPKRAGQLRGVSPLAPILARLRSTGDFEDAVLERQKLANLFVAFITRQLPTGSDGDIDALGNAIEHGPLGEALAGMAPGLLQELDPGQDVTFSEPPEAGIEYAAYLRSNALGTSSGLGIPYELFSGDIQNVSDRTLRVIVNEFRRLCEQRQWQMIIPMFCQPVIEWFAEAAVLVGKIDIGEIDAVKRVEHAPHGWAYIHPVQDVQGKQLELESGLNSRSAIIGARGDDAEQIDEERAADKAREKKLGIEPLQPSNKPGQQPGQKQQGNQ